MESEVPKFKKVGHVTLATPNLGSFLTHYVVLAAVDLTKKTRKNVDRRQNYRNPRWRPSAILGFRKSDF